MKFSNIFVGFMLLGAVGCGPQDTGAADEMRNKDVMGPGDTGTTVDYPKGDVGFNVGQQVSNLSFLIKQNGQSDIGKDPAKVTMADFYAMRKTGAKLLLLSGAAEWCGPCNAEADAYVRIMKDPDFVTYLNSKGGLQALQVVQVVMQNADYSASDKDTIDRWLRAHKIDGFGVGIDPKSQVSLYIPANAIPQSLYVNLADMTLVGREVGSPTMDSALIEKLKTYLNKVSK